MAMAQEPLGVEACAEPRAHLSLCRAQDLESVDALAEPWRRMDAQCASPLTQFIWTRAALSAFETEADPCVLAALAGDELKAVAPLASRRGQGIRRWCLAGVAQLFEPGDFAWTDQRALERLIGRLVLSGTPLLFERVPAESSSLQKLRRGYRARGIVVTRPQAPSPFIALDESWLEPESHLNAGRRSDLRRARRKAEQSGAVTTEIHNPDLDGLPRLLDTAFEVESRGWKGDTGTALVHDAHRAVFYRQYCEAACVEGILRICFLRIGDRVAAMQLAVEQGGGFWLLKVGYDDRFAGCSPGLLLMRDTIRYAVEAGLSSYEFLGRAESWTRTWTQTERQYVSVRVYPFGLRGLLAATVDGVAFLRRRRLQRCTS
jgi:CelD/BcsL family acetyltransferase involved in cellulose biosynthesis